MDPESQHNQTQTQDLPSASSSQTPPNQIEETKRVSRLVVFAVSLFLAILIPAGVFLYSKHQNQPKTVSIATPSPSPTPTPDPMASWQTYTATDSGFSFKYPNDWAVVEINPSGILIAPKAQAAALKKQLSYGPQGGGTGETLTISWSDQKFNSIIYTSDETRNISVKDVKVNGADSQQYVSTYLQDLPGIPQGSIITTTVISNNNKTYIAELLLNQYKNIYDQILSTFKFTNSQSSLNTSTWKTYTNSDYGFTFKYPSQFSLEDKKRQAYASTVGEDGYDMTFSTGKLIPNGGNNTIKDFSGFSVIVIPLNGKTFKEYQTDIKNKYPEITFSNIPVVGNAQEAAEQLDPAGSGKLYKYGNYVYEISSFQNAAQGNGSEDINKYTDKIFLTLKFAR